MTGGDSSRQLPITRNEGVPGSSPGVGLKGPAQRQLFGTAEHFTRDERVLALTLCLFCRDFQRLPDPPSLSCLEKRPPAVHQVELLSVQTHRQGRRSVTVDQSQQPARYLAPRNRALRCSWCLAPSSRSEQVSKRARDGESSPVTDLRSLRGSRRRPRERLVGCRRHEPQRPRPAWGRAFRPGSSCAKRRASSARERTPSLR
jgi:hypothetical protein